MKIFKPFKFILILFLIVFSNDICKAQQPAYTIFGEDQFRGVQIYDVIQDKEKNFLISTNEGLFYYNYINYEKIECSQAKSNSVFNLIIDKFGTIYCNNINNQIFKIQKRKMRLYYELNKEDSNADISLAIGNDNNLLISSRNVVALNSTGKVIAKTKNIHNYLNQPFSLKSGEIVYHVSDSRRLIVYKNGKFTNKLFQTSEESLSLKLFYIHSKIYGFDLLNKELFVFDYGQLKLTKSTENPFQKENQHIRIYETSLGAFMAGTLPGCYFFSKNISQTKLWYPDYFISDVYVDHEGNLLLSTFDKGILLISDIHAPDVLIDYQDDPITSIETTKNKVILGSSKGQLSLFERSICIPINSTGKRPIEILKANPSGSHLIFNDGEIRLYNLNTNNITSLFSHSLKDVSFINNTQCYIGTNLGVYFLDFTKNEFKILAVEQFRERIHHVSFNKFYRSLYVSSISGVFYFKENQKPIPILYKNKEIYPIDICSFGNKTYICTKEDGILVYKKNKLIQQIKLIDKGKKIIIEKIAHFKQDFIGKSSNGIFLFNNKGKLLKSFHTIFGFQNKRIIDFSLQDNILWVSHSGGIQKINLHQQKSISKQYLSTRIEELHVNNTSHKLTKQKAVFTSDQRKFVFTVSAPTLRNRELLNYQYRLIGADSTWNSNSYQNNQIVFNSLAPGKYQFELKVEYNGQFSPTVIYKFEIKAPFYFRWWFISLVIISFLFFVYQIYKRQLAKQKRKSDQINELNASKLTAIQSQMNPHFIFNAMNSIQDLILKGNVEHSYSYITTFSNLVRKTLNYSEREFIEFEQEIELLKLYLSLEKLRFKTEFTYSIDTNSISSIKIPPMLIQPFIENALGHGLIHRDGEKKLHISFDLQDVLLCKIEDNGVGRNKAKEIRERQRADHESFSGKAIQKRFEILSNHYNGKLGFEYVDKIENGESTGTIVFLKIPYFQNF